MNPLVLLPLLAAACTAAPTGDAAMPVIAHTEVKAHVPVGVQLQEVGQAVAVPQPVVAAVPGYKVEGEVRQITQTVPQPEPVAVDVNNLPVLAAPVAAAAPYTAAYTLPAASTTYGLSPASVPVASVPVAPVAAAPITYTNLNLNIPAPVPAGEATGDLVQSLPVKALGRPSISYTPQVTEVRPELKIYERTFDVPVPKPVYDTQHVTPVHTKYVAEPYAVPQPYPVPQPYAVPQPYPVHQPYAALQPYAAPAVQSAFVALAED